MGTLGSHVGSASDSHAGFQEDGSGTEAEHGPQAWRWGGAPTLGTSRGDFVGAQDLIWAGQDKSQFDVRGWRGHGTLEFQSTQHLQPGKQSLKNETRCTRGGACLDAEHSAKLVRCPTCQPPMLVSTVWLSPAHSWVLPWVLNGRGPVLLLQTYVHPRGLTLNEALAKRDECTKGEHPRKTENEETWQHEGSGFTTSTK